MYISLMITVCLIPITIMGFGLLWKKHPPQSINWIYGYRTRMSMKNEETWKFAHLYHGQVWFWGGTILFVISLIIMILFRENHEKISVWIIFIQLAIMILSVIPTEIALRRRFDRDGQPRS